MRHRFYTTPETAHELTAKKKQGFYFRTLTRTDRGDRVYCETTEPGYHFIIEQGYDVEWVEVKELESSNWGGYRSGAGRSTTDRNIMVGVRISQEAADILNAQPNKSEFIDRIIKEFGNK